MNYTISKLLLPSPFMSASQGKYAYPVFTGEETKLQKE